MSALRRLLFLALWLLPIAVGATEIQRVTTRAGIELWYVQEKSVPIVTVNFAFRRAGASGEPEGKEGLAEFHATLLKEGAGPHEGLAFRQRLERFGIDLSFDGGRDRVSGSLRSLTDHAEEAFTLLGHAMTRPLFAEGEVARARERTLAAIRRQDEDHRGSAWRKWMAESFPGHPYGRLTRGTLESVGALSRDDLLAQHRRLGRDVLVLAAVGDLPASEIARLADLAFAALPAAAAVSPVVADAVPAARGVHVIRRAIPQAQVAFALPGVKRGDPDYYAAYLMNYVLGGGGFVSRLYREIREQRGLAYSVASYLAPMDHAGLYSGAVGTANERVGESIQLVKAAFARMRDEGVSAAELADAKTYVTGSFPLGLDTNSKIAATLVAVQWDRLGIDFLRRRNALFEAVTVEDV
ncbi:MAG: insulinase family protein, partial [Alphaproteobacteria bacterium]|nr:insulinase family protein [Alphaproteobacteria bacterium]